MGRCIDSIKFSQEAAPPVHHHVPEGKQLSPCPEILSLHQQLNPYKDFLTNRHRILWTKQRLNTKTVWSLESEIESDTDLLELEELSHGIAQTYLSWKNCPMA